jgi:hypothetical protein
VAGRSGEGGGDTLKVYLAARYSRREELCGYADELRVVGFEVTSRWLAGNHQISDAGLSEQAQAEERTRFATEDWEDLMAADVTISFTEPPRGTNSRGGRHVEFGAALAVGQQCFVVGHRENVFHCLEGVQFCETWTNCFLELVAYRQMWEITDRALAAVFPPK